MTKIRQAHIDEQMEAARADFLKGWEAECGPKEWLVFKKVPLAEIAIIENLAWKHFLEKRGVK